MTDVETPDRNAKCEGLLLRKPADMKIMLTNSPMMLAKVVVHYPLSP
jgi:hypothetical protein